MTAVIAGRVVSPTREGVRATLTLTPVDGPVGIRDESGRAVLAAPALIAADDGVLRTEVIAGRYGLRLTVGATVSVEQDVVLTDGVVYDLTELLGIAPGGGVGPDIGGDTEPLITVAADGLRLLVPDRMVAGDGMTYTMTDADAAGVGLIMIGD